MPNREAEVKELKPRQESPVAQIFERAGEGPADPELIRNLEESNRATARRIAENEAARCLPLLEQAALVAQRGSQLYAMAAFAQDKETQEALGEALERLRDAAA
jgi:hypothetical protein